MNILAIDTSGPVAGCAVMADGKIRHLIAMEHGRTHSEAIMPAIDRALTSSGLTARAIDLFAVVAGPGSFTGVRIGVCAAKGLAHAWRKPCVAIHALEALAMNLAGFRGLICPILDARRDQVYCAAFDAEDGRPRRAMPDDALPIDAFLARLPKDARLAFVGDGVPMHAARIKDALGARAFLPPANLLSLRADAVCALAAEKEAEYVDARQLAPVYLRKPQAERERMERLSHA
jgi:tRNA threonylcarbamoyladenosine biosynthesis protein TsaB